MRNITRSSRQSFLIHLIGNSRVTSRDVESLVNCSILPMSGGRLQCPTPPDNRFQQTTYSNVPLSDTLDAERSARQHAVRKTVATASLQIVLLSKALLNHVGLHANDPLGTLLHPKRVLGLLLGVDETKDVMPIHQSGNLIHIWRSITNLFMILFLFY